MGASGAGGPGANGTRTSGGTGERRWGQAPGSGTGSDTGERYRQRHRQRPRGQEPGNGTGDRHRERHRQRPRGQEPGNAAGPGRARGSPGGPGEPGRARRAGGAGRAGRGPGALRAPLRAAIGWKLTTGQGPPPSRAIGCGRGAAACHWLRAVSVTARPRSAAALAGPSAGSGAGPAAPGLGAAPGPARRSAGLGPRPGPFPVTGSELDAWFASVLVKSPIDHTPVSFFREEIPPGIGAWMLEGAGSGGGVIAPGGVEGRPVELSALLADKRCSLPGWTRRSLPVSRRVFVPDSLGSRAAVVREEEAFVVVHSRTFSSEIELQEKVHFPEVRFHPSDGCRRTSKRGWKSAGSRSSTSKTSPN
ncbi:fibroin heavy chain-like [Motacilla alba alba]|uniref:fibroin heavy chain-like n=1 Tax=Motacilla alba alba TaxID=1094192 RepID=UPI0018D505BE|nr:fibroin heavy chain-like [Motacilla alba alba]